MTSQATTNNEVRKGAHRGNQNRETLEPTYLVKRWAVAGIGLQARRHQILHRATPEERPHEASEEKRRGSAVQTPKKHGRRALLQPPSTQRATKRARTNQTSDQQRLAQTIKPQAGYISISMLPLFYFSSARERCVLASNSRRRQHPQTQENAKQSVPSTAPPAK